jgi:hydrogenase small subunit
MAINRRDFLKGSALLAAALGVKLPGFLKDRNAYAAEGGLPVVWLQAQGCTGCSVSFLNSIYYTTVDDLLLNKLDVEYHPNVMAAAGSTAVNAAIDRRNKGGYALIVEGAIPTAGAGQYCYLWPGVTALDGVKDFAKKASYIIAVGSCAAFGGMPAGTPNPTGSKGVKAVLSAAGIGTSNLINIPGCPAHPDWLVGTIAYVLKYGKAPALDSNSRPTTYYGIKVHDKCPNLDKYNKGFARYERHSQQTACYACHDYRDEDLRGLGASKLGDSGCLYGLGCKGRWTSADCPVRKWNGGAAQTAGVNWCVDAGSPCHGCTEPNFPDGMSPFFALGNDGGVEDD